MYRSDESPLVSDNEDEVEQHEAPSLQSAAPLTTVSDIEAPRVPGNNHRSAHKWFILEPAVFLIFTGRYLIGAVIQNEILFQTCITIMQRNATECDPLKGKHRGTEKSKPIEEEAQKYSADITMVISLLESIIPAFVCLFIGAWSDRFGRRPVLLAVFSGYVLAAGLLIGITQVATFNNISPWWFLLYSVPAVFTGGTCALITVIYCYISDVAKERNKAQRMILNEASLCTGMVIGNLSSGYIYDETSLLALIIIAGILMFLGLAFVYFWVPESLENIHTGSRMRDFFRISLVKDLLRTCFLQRTNYDRAIIWLTMMALTISVFNMEAENTVNVMFLREKFNWNVKDITNFSAIRIVVQIIGSIIGTILLRRLLKVSIVSVALVAIGACVLESTVRATAQHWWEMYLGTVLGMMRGVLGPMCRAIISHIAPSTDVGKIFALTTSMEMVSPLIGAPLYTAVYKATVSINPGIFNFISAALHFVSYIAMAIIFGIQSMMENTSVYKAIGS